LQRGVDLEDGITAPAELNIVKDSEMTTWLSLTLREGRKHQVKRMCSAVGHPVLKLRRIKVGPIGLGNLRPGESRRLKSREIKALRRAVGLDK
jgi:23S rRNA pseudouridine2605 synthase